MGMVGAVSRRSRVFSTHHMPQLALTVAALALPLLVSRVTIHAANKLGPFALLFFLGKL
jgi:hypothetical protein